MNRWKRRLAGTMAAVMLTGLLPVFPGLSTVALAAESTQDAYGFDLNVPDSFDPDDGVNPYGSAAITGHVNFNPVKELGIFESAANYQRNVALNIDRNEGYTIVLPALSGDGHYYRVNSQLIGKLPRANHTYFEKGYYNRMKFVRGVAYDPTGSGKDDHIVYYGFGNQSEGKAGTKAPGFIAFSAKEGQSGSDNTVYKGDSQYYDWMDRLSSYEADGYNALVAGDFNGDGKDTILVYDPAKGNLQLKEYVNVNNDPVTAIHIGSDSTLAGYFNDITLNAIQTGNNDLHDNTAMVHLAAGDLDGDGDDELVATISLGDLHSGKESDIGTNYYEDDGGSTASVVAVYNQSKSNSAWQMVYHTQMANVYDGEHINSGKDGKYEGWFMRSAASAIGDIDGDGSPEIVTVGLPADDLRHDDDDLRKDAMIFTIIDCGSGYSLRTMDNPVKNKGGTEDYSAHPDTIPQGWFILNDTDTGFGDWANAQSSYACNPPLSIGCVQLEGTGTTPYVFARGHIFQFTEESGKMQFKAAKNLGSTGDDKNLDRYLQDMTYVSQPVIANFDGNEQGRQQAYFVVGTRGSSDYNWIIGLAYYPHKGKVMDGTGLYSCDWDTNVLDRNPSYSAFVALTAPDVDTDDGLLAQYKSKEYTWADPEIMAILEASPYFEDLVDEYAETAGSTAFGTGKGSGSGTSETSSTRAGAYMSFSQDFGPFGFSIFSAEMEASFESEWSSEVAMTTEYEYETTFETGRDYNQVLLIRTPVIVYTYEVTDPGGNKSEMNITTAQKPLYCMIPVEKYNEMARQLGDTVIGPDIVSAVPGQPDTYRTNTNDLTGKNPQTLDGQWVDAGGGGNSVVTQSITKTNTEEITTSLTHSFDTKAGAGVMGLTLGVSGGASQTKAQSTTNTESITRSGTVSSVPAKYADDYGFQWKFLTWDAQIDDYTVPVLTYLVKEVRQPPSLPQNVSAVAETTSVTLSWEAGFNSAERYEIARYLPEDGSYNHVGTVMGNAADEDGTYTYEITGLTPGMSYSYALRAVGDGKYSSYTEPLTVVTASEGAGLPSVLQQPEDQSLRPGGEAKFEISAISGGGESISFQWQTRKAGQIAWRNVQNANSDVLTIANVTEDMNGNQYRCQVSQLSNSSSTKVFVYSDAATLTVGKAGSQTTAAVSSEGGTADYVVDKDGTATITKVYAVTIGEETHNYHAYGKEAPYYYCVDDGRYYRLAGLNVTEDDTAQSGVFAATASGRTELANLSGALVQTADGTMTRIASVDDLHSTLQATATFGEDETVYNVFNAQGVAVDVKDDQPMYTLSESTLTLYQKQNDPSGKFYVESGTYNAETESVGMSLKEVTQATDPETLVNLTYFGTPEKVWSDTEYEEDGGYTVLTFGDGTTNLYQKDEDYYTRTGSGEDEPSYTYTLLTLLTTTEDGTGDAIVTTTPLGTVTGNVISDRIDHKSDVPAETTEIKTTTQESLNGQSVTLTATVTGGGTGKVIFQIVNTTTGSMQNVEATLSDGQAKAQWRPTVAGVYQITATYQGDSKTMPSTSQPVTYYAYANPEASTGYRLKLAESLPYGDTITPSLVQWTEQNGKITETEQSTGSITYTAHAYLGEGQEGADSGGYSEASVDGWQRGGILAPGNYLIRAKWGEDNTASVKLAVTKREVTVTAPTIQKLSVENVEGFDLAEYLKDIEVAGSILESDAQIYGGAKEGYPELFRLTGGPQASAGSYDINVDYAANGSAPTEEQQTAYADFWNKYLPTLKKSVVYVEADVVTVTYEAGANGDLTAQISGTTVASGEAVSIGSKLVFTATPEGGFQVSNWTINGVPVTGSTDGVTLIPASNSLIVNSVAEDMTVRVEFSNESHTISFSAGENGTVSAATPDGTPISNGATVVGGSAVTFTAQPEAGYVVESWTVNNEIQKNKDGSNYSADTLTLENISVNTTVAVAFTESVDYTVTFTAVDSETKENLTAGVELTYEGLDETGKAPKGSTVTLIAKPSVGNAILEWQVRQGDGQWVNLADAQQSYTIQNLQSDMAIRVLVNTKATTYSVTFGVYDESNLEMPAENAGTLSATVNSVPIETGAALPNGSTVVFAYTEPEDYEFVRWEVSGQEAQESGTTCTVENLMADTEVKAVVAKKPQVTIEQAEHGTVTVTANGQPVEDGAYISNGTDLAVTLEPDIGYEVDSSISADYTDGDGSTTDDKTYTISNVTEAQTITAAWSELPTQEVTFSVVETTGEGGTNGGLTAAVDRKGMEDYAVEEFTSGDSIYRDSIVTFTAVADSGYRVKEWTVNGEIYQVEDSAFIGNVLALPYEELTGEVAVQFELGDARIVFTDPEHGTLNAVSAGLDFTSGGSSRADVVFTVEPEDNYEVKAWTVNGSIVEGETDTEFTYTPDGSNVTIAVELQGVALDVTAEASEGGTVSGLPDEIRYGDEVTLTAIPDAGYAFEGWYLDGEHIPDAAETYTFTAAETASYEARFSPTADNTVSFSVSDEQMGSITATANGTPIISGDQLAGGQEIIFTVTPAGGYRVKEWNGLPESAEISADKNTVSISALSGTLTVQAVLEAIPQRTITLLAPEGKGTITAQVDGVAVTSVPDGTVVTFTADPEAGWMLEQWTGDADGQKAQSFTMEITKDVTIGAVFTGAVHYTVQYSMTGTGGSISAKANGSTDIVQDTEVQLVADSSIVFTAVPEDKFMVAKWTVNDVEQETLSNTLTIDKLGGNTTVTVKFETYQGFTIPVGGTGYTITNVVRDPAETYKGAPETEIRKGGDVTFTVGLAEDYTTISQMVINGYDCIAESGEVTGCDSVSAVKNSNGSYTVTISGVAGAITTEITAHRLVVGELTVPEAFENNPELNTVEKIQSKLSAAVTGSRDGIVYYDIALKYLSEGGWVEVTEENFPEDGVDVVLPYPAGTDSKDTFTVIHMLTTGKNPGSTEKVTCQAEADGIHFHVDSLSPFAVSWEKYEEPVTPPTPGGGGGGGGAVSAGYKITIEAGDHGTVTSDKKAAEEDETVRLTVRADDGYVLDSLTVTKENGGTVKIADKGDGTYSFTMPDSDVEVWANFIPVSEWINPFVDVPEGVWYYDAVKYVNENGLMAGTSANTFAPDLTTTRGMIVTILYRLEGTPDIENEIWGYPFKDVDADAWYATAVYWARMNGIVAGYSDELFGPNDIITREQMATILYRYAQYKGYDTTAKANLSSYTDAAQVGSWALDAIRWANAEGLVNGTSSTTLSPQGSATRSQVAVILTRFCQNIIK